MFRMIAPRSAGPGRLSRARGVAALAAVLVLPSLSAAKDPAEPAEAEQSYDPPIAEASGEPANALAGFTLPEGVSGSVWAAEPLFANPVAFDLDHRGRAFVCETFRQKEGVEDNRSHMDWLRADLSAMTVEDRAAYMRAYVEDADARYTAEQDRIRLVTDADGDGRADGSTVFAGGFDSLLTGTGAGVLARPNGDVYYTCIPDLWRLKDTDGDGVADEKEVLSTGYGVRFAFRGHDMHGLTVGPDGRLYWSIGDRGFHVLTPEGELLHRPDTGAVFRSEPDGSNLELFAKGLRNPQELAFDDAGNLFTWDNNSDSGDKARWVHVIQGSDSGWRMYFQYLDDRGPWNREMMWVPRDVPASVTFGATGVPAETAAATIQPAYSLPPLANIGDGPSGLTYDPGVGLPRELRGHFFACDFRGTPGNSGVRHWTNERVGATFKPVDLGKYVWGVLATDAAFAPDGSLFVSDWVTGWVGEGKGRLYRFAQTDHPAEESAELLAAGFDELEDSRLVELLIHADRRVRLEAQLELAERNATDSLLSVAEDATADPFARRHAVWGYGQCVRAHAADATPLATLAADDDPVLRWWAVRLLGELAPGEHADTITNALRDDDARVVREAALALGGAAGPDPAAAGWLREVVAERGDDPALFHAASVGLSGAATPEELAAFLGVSFASRPGRTAAEVAAQNERLHLAAVVAARRIGPAALAGLLDRAADASTPRVRLELFRAAVDEPAADGALIARVAAFPGLPEFEFQIFTDPGDAAVLDATHRRGLMANFLLGDRDSARNVLEVAAEPNVPANLRAEALAELTMWDAPDRLDRVTGRLRPAEEWAAVSDANRIEKDGERPEKDRVSRDAGFLPALLARQVDALLDGPPEVRAAAVALLAKYDVEGALGPIRALAESDAEPAAVRTAAVKAVDRLADGALADGAVAAQVARRALTSNDAAVRAAARAILVKRDPAAAVSTLADALESGETLERQEAVAALAKLRSDEADAVLKTWLEKLVNGEAPPEIALELLEAAEARKTGGFEKYLVAYNARRGADKTDAWSESLRGGDPVAGADIFFNRASVSCQRCHIAEGRGGEVGPSLDGIAAQKGKDRAYLLESIVVPSAKIAEGFATAVVLTEDGQVHTGVLKSETDEAITLILVDGTKTRELAIPTDTILDRADGPSAMPADIPDHLSKRDMRDLVAYLTTLKEVPAADHGGEE